MPPMWSKRYDLPFFPFRTFRLEYNMNKFSRLTGNYIHIRISLPKAKIYNVYAWTLHILFVHAQHTHVDTNIHLTRQWTNASDCHLYQLLYNSCIIFKFYMTVVVYDSLNLSSLWFSWVVPNLMRIITQHHYCWVIHLLSPLKVYGKASLKM